MRLLRAALALSALIATAPAAAQRAVPAVHRGFTDPAEHRVLRVSVAPDVALEVLDWGGSGPALVFLAGFSNTGHVFDTFAPRFTGSFRVVTLTRRGLGTSDRPNPGPYDAATLAADVKAVLDTLGIARANLVGYSFGGTEMSYFAAAYPERTARIVYLDSYCGGCDTLAPRRRRPPIRPAGPALQDRDTLTAEGMMAYQRRTMGFSYPEAELRLINHYENGTVRTAVPAFVWQALGRGVPHPGLAKIAAPALAIFAERSTVEHEFWWARRMNPAVRALAQVYVDVVTENRRASQDHFIRALPNAHAAVIPGAHHAIFLSHPDETERLIREFLLAPPMDSTRSANR
ncbi:MAG TPA: alpha/beta hydrolase [Longimicrobium sp.]|nr:alpha/beta hydrolase [Longimicrobium sp.]